MEKSLLLSNARIVLPDRVLERGWLLVEAGCIAGVSEDKPAGITAGVPEHDLSGVTLFPGFIDVHIHGAVGVDTMAARADDLLRVARYLASQGVTGWLPTLVPASQAQYSSAVQAIEDRLREQGQAAAQSTDSGEDPQRGSVEKGARVLGLHYEGPFVNVAQCGALHTEFFRAYSGPADITALPVPRTAGAARMITVAPEIEGGIELVRELNDQGWIVALGHTRASAELLDRAFAAGARHLTHFMNAMPQLHHRSPGPVGWGLSRADVTCDIIADGKHLDPLTLRLLLQVKSPERLTLISDAIAAAGLGDGDYQIWGETISVANGRTRNAHGSIAGSVITMLDGVRMMLSLGVSEVEVARMAATNPARLLRLDHDCGSIEEGKRADLVGLDQAGKVRLAMVGGALGFC
jgi:N-acetylglucosamine-6-phosphate deacetylase